MPAYATPGAYIERDDRAPGGISGLRTDVAAFVGIAERGPARRAVAVESWKQFQSIFGGVFPHGYLAYVVRAFFENGGRRCFIVRVESDAVQIAATILTDATAVPVWSLEANSSGTWGNGLDARLVEVRRVVRRALTATTDWAAVDTIAGFGRATTVELLQETGAAVHRELRILSAVEASGGRLTWNHLDPAVRLPSDAPLALIDPTRPLRIETVSYQLQVTGNGRLLRVYDDLALSPRHTRYGPMIVNGVAQLFAPDPSRLADDTATANLVAFGKRAKTAFAPEPVRLVELRDAPGLVPTRLATGPAPLALAGGFDGLSSLGVADFVGFEDPANDSAEALLANRRGLAALAEIDEVSLVAVPDIHIQPRLVVKHPQPVCVPDPCLPGPPPLPVPRFPDHTDLPPRLSPSQIEQVVTALVAHCERRADRVALIDPPFDAATRDRLGLAAIRDYRQLFDSSYATLYFPWLEVLDPIPGTRAPTLAIPPCGHVAGQIAATDLRVGVHKAPANVPLVMAERATFVLDETSHGILNSDGINVIRAIPGRGLRIAGARLVSSHSDLQFLNVRRLLLMIERSFETSLQWAVFEGNDWLLRAKLTLHIDSFLRELWARGALMGATANEAYYVRCNDSNNDADARARGELLIEIGVAPSVPFEFVVLRIGRTAESFELTESGHGGGG
jgi:phage tail sheath protein FI